MRRYNVGQGNFANAIEALGRSGAADKTAAVLRRQGIPPGACRAQWQKFVSILEARRHTRSITRPITGPITGPITRPISGGSRQGCGPQRDEPPDRAPARAHHRLSARKRWPSKGAPGLLRPAGRQRFGPNGLAPRRQINHGRREGLLGRLASTVCRCLVYEAAGCRGRRLLKPRSCRCGGPSSWICGVIRSL
jgi:ribosomal protein S28E/S33